MSGVCLYSPCMHPLCAVPLCVGYRQRASSSSNLFQLRMSPLWSAGICKRRMWGGEYDKTCRRERSTDKKPLPRKPDAGLLECTLFICRLLNHFPCHLNSLDLIIRSFILFLFNFSLSLSLSHPPPLQVAHSTTVRYFQMVQVAFNGTALYCISQVELLEFTSQCVKIVVFSTERFIK